jgi:ribosomal protein S12 methylthiotransferase
MIKKVGILSLGCPRNLVDSENIAGRLRSKGYSIVNIDKAEVAIVNTCAFIQDAKQESIDVILDLIELKKEGRLKKILVYGCLSQRYKKQLRKELPEVDAFVGAVSLNHSYHKRYPITPRHFTYLKICEGCIDNCSFCVIPKIKGKFTSLTIDSIVEKVGEFAGQGVSEINIIGQDISAYGLDLYGKPRLSGLLKKIASASGNIKWIRLLYLNPARFGDDLLKVIKNEPKVCKYIDLPIQHINDRILKLMNRRVPNYGLLKIIEKIRKEIPEAGIRTSIIVGFPSETEREFKQLLEFVKSARFERLGAFIYSREEGTRAYHLKKQVPEKIQRERFSEIMRVQQGISRDINAKFLGKTLDVLIDECEKDNYLGRSYMDAPEVDGTVYVRSKNRLKPGDMVKAKVTDTLEYDLVGEAV